MVYGLSTFQLASVLTPLIGAGITAIIYLFAFNKQENSRIASNAETERWVEVKKLYGGMISNHYISIQNSPNTFIELSDPDNSAKVIAEIVDETEEFKELGNAISRMQRPQWYHKWCRRGAEYAPWTFLASAVVLTISIFSTRPYQTLLFIIGMLIVVSALALTGTFLYFRAKMNGVADDLRFRT